jgi:hypothetical protein
MKSEVWGHEIRSRHKVRSKKVGSGHVRLSLMSGNDIIMTMSIFLLIKMFCFCFLFFPRGAGGGGGAGGVPY